MRILVAGVGNVLKGDDGFGVRAIEALMARGSLPDGVNAIETGIGGIHLVQELGQGYEALILLDAMDRGGQPGELYLVEPMLPDLAGMDDKERRDFFADVHYATPVRALTMASAIGALPGLVRIIGCQPRDAESFGSAMSEPVAAAIARSIELIDSVLGQMRSSRP